MGQVSPSGMHQMTRTESGLAERAVQRFDGDLALLGRQAASSQPRSDQMLVSTDCCFDETASGVTGCPLPSHAALLRDKSDVFVALTLQVNRVDLSAIAPFQSDATRPGSSTLRR
jgi:hypothetical protein